jgi:hypothetical protein
MTTIATAQSETGPLSGQKQRSGGNFTLHSDAGTDITLTTVAGVIFDILVDKPHAPDPSVVRNAGNGFVVRGGTLSTGTNYYIANPKGATAPFTVTLNQ